MDTKNIKIIAGVAVVVIVAVIVTIVINSGGNDSDDQDVNRVDNTDNTTQGASPVITEKKIITITEDGYSPENIEVEQGTTVVFENESGPDRWPASNDHPTHLKYPEFDPKQAISAGDSWEFRFDQIGEWGYHDHLRPEIVGTIFVTEPTRQPQQAPADQTPIPTEPYVESAK